MTSMEQRIAACLSHHMPAATGVVVDGLARIHGGSSQETFRLQASWQEGDRAVRRALILRRKPPAGLIQSDDDVEYNVYAALAGRSVPVPGVYFREEDPRWLDRPFFVMDLMPGKAGEYWLPHDIFEGRADQVARSFWQHLGTLAAIDHREAGLAGLRNGEAGSGYWARELDHWEAVLDAGEFAVEPIVRGAIRWLRRHPPHEPAKPAIVHGDYRPGNFLFTPDGRISTILDWEMCHVGDPLEDVAWAINGLWSMTKYFPLEEGLAIWERASGMAAVRQDLDWWRLFVAVKACALWTTAERSFEDGTSGEMIVAITAVNGGHVHRMEILDRMMAFGEHGA